MQEFEPGKYQPGEMIEQLEMNAGDLLYIPRGVMHQAETDDQTGHGEEPGTIGLRGIALDRSRHGRCRGS
jgi:hypothetical protein